MKNLQHKPNRFSSLYGQHPTGITILCLENKFEGKRCLYKRVS